MFQAIIWIDHRFYQWNELIELHQIQYNLIDKEFDINIPGRIASFGNDD